MLKIPNETTLAREFKSYMYEFYIIIRVLNKLFEGDLIELSKKVKLTFPQYLTLLIINHDDGLMVSKISRIGSWHVSTVMNQLDSLSDKKLILLQKAEKGKGTCVYITDMGRKAITQNIETPPQKISKIIHSAGFTALEENLRFFYSVLNKVLGEKYMSEIKEHIIKSREIILNE